MSEKISFQELIEKLCERTGVQKDVAEDFVREFFDVIVHSLGVDGQCKIKGLGTFKLKKVEERKSISVQNGTEIVIPAHSKVSFSPEKGLGDEVNKPYAHLHTYVLAEGAPIEMTDDVEEEEEDDVPESKSKEQPERIKLDVSNFIIDDEDYSEDKPVFASPVRASIQDSPRVEAPKSIVIEPHRSSLSEESSQPQLEMIPTLQQSAAEPKSSVRHEPEPTPSAQPIASEPAHMEVPQTEPISPSQHVENPVSELKREMPNPAPVESSRLEPTFAEQTVESQTAETKPTEPEPAHEEAPSPEPIVTNQAAEPQPVEIHSMESKPACEEVARPEKEPMAQVVDAQPDEAISENTEPAIATQTVENQESESKPIEPESIAENSEKTEPIASALEQSEEPNSESTEKVIPTAEMTNENSDDESTQDEEETKVAAKPDIKKKGMSSGVEKKSGKGLLIFIICLLLLALFGVLGFLFRNEIKKLIYGENPNTVEVTVEPVASNDETQQSSMVEEIETQDRTPDSFDNVEVEGVSQPQTSEEETAETVIEQSFSNSESAKEETPVDKPVVKPSKYKFAPELVEYMSDHNPDMDLSINDLLDEVVLAPKQRLVDVALKYYGHKYYWVYLYYFNKKAIKNPNVVSPGTKLLVPQLSKSLVNKADQRTLDVAFAVKNDLIEKK